MAYGFALAIYAVSSGLLSDLVTLHTDDGLTAACQLFQYMAQH